MKKVFSILVNTFLALMILIGCLLLFSIFPIKNNIKILSVKSGSMEPTIRTGSVILIKPVVDYQEGEIITFLTPNAKAKDDYTTHRIFKINNYTESRSFITKGDANDSPDVQTITQDKIIGKYYGNIPYLGYLISYIKTLPGLLCIIILPSAIIIIEEIKKIHKETTNIVKKRKKKFQENISDQN